MISEAELAAIEARCNAATPGPWKIICRHSGNANNDPAWEGHWLGWEIEGPPRADGRGQFDRGYDAIFIAEARTDMPRLIEEVRRLGAELEAALMLGSMTQDELDAAMERKLNAPNFDAPEL